MSTFVQEVGHDGSALQSALEHLMPGQVQGVVHLLGHSGTDSVASTPELSQLPGHRPRLSLRENLVKNFGTPQRIRLSRRG